MNDLSITIICIIVGLDCLLIGYVFGRDGRKYPHYTLDDSLDEPAKVEW